MKTMIVILFNDENQKYDQKQFEFIIRQWKNRKQSLTIWAIWAIKNSAFSPLQHSLDPTFHFDYGFHVDKARKIKQPLHEYMYFKKEK